MARLAAWVPPPRMHLTRVLGIDIEACARCGGKLKVIASIEEPAVIAKILAHLQRTGAARAVQFAKRVGVIGSLLKSRLYTGSAK